MSVSADQYRALELKLAESVARESSLRSQLAAAEASIGQLSRALSAATAPTAPTAPTAATTPSSALLNSWEPTWKHELSAPMMATTPKGVKEEAEMTEEVEEEEEEEEQQPKAKATVATGGAGAGAGFGFGFEFGGGGGAGAGAAAAAPAPAPAPDAFAFAFGGAGAGPGPVPGAGRGGGGGGGARVAPAAKWNQYISHVRGGGALRAAYTPIWSGVSIGLSLTPLQHATEPRTTVEKLTTFARAWCRHYAGLIASPSAEVVLDALDVIAVGFAEAALLSAEMRRSTLEWFEEAGGLDALEHLQTHDNEQIYTLAVRLLADHFDSAEEEEEPTSAATATLYSEF